MKNLNNVLNKICAWVLLSVFVIMLVYLLEPLLYNGGSKGKTIEKNYEKLILLDNILNRYIYSYIDENYNKNVSEMFHIIKRNNSKIQYGHEFLTKNLNKIKLHNIEECFNNKYIIYYSVTDNLDEDQNNVYKLIVNIDYLNDVFSIYYDSLIENRIEE